MHNQAKTILKVERLRPTFEALHEKISYDELSILRLYYLTQHTAQP